MKRLTASKLKLFTRCQYPWRDDVEWLEDRGNAAADRGKEIHSEIERALAGELVISGVVAWIEEAPESPFSDPGVRHIEHALAWNSKTGEVLELPRVKDRAYPDGDGFVFGTADLILESETEIRVIDWKTGKREYVGDAYKSEQLRFLAAAFVAAKPGRESKRVRLELWFVGDEKFIDIAIWDPTGHLDELADKIEMVKFAQDNPNTECRFCPARVSCPSITTQLAPKVRVPMKLSEIVDSQHARSLLLLKSQAEKFAEHLDALTKDYARENGHIETEDGKSWGPTQSTYKTTDANKALELARDLGASEEDIAACQRDSVRTVFRETRRSAGRS